MKQHYDPKRFFDFLGYRPAAEPYHCDGLKALSIHCVGNASQLENLLDPLPFTLEDDRFLVTIADFGNSDVGSFYDAAVILNVRYGDHVGGAYAFEFENTSWSVAAGRELWGYPKQYAEIELAADEHGAAGRVWLGEEELFSISSEFSANAGREAWSDISFYPHLLVNAQPDPMSHSFRSFEVLRRDTSPNFALSSARYGSGAVRFGTRVGVQGQALEVMDVLGAEYTIGDFSSTSAHGIPTRIASLI